MNTKEIIKDKIDHLSEEFLDDVLAYLNELKKANTSKKKISGLHLKGQFDDINIRQEAYE